ncbi:MAG: fatty acid desaturase family protein [Aquirhabdus sp.]
MSDTAATITLTSEQRAELNRKSDKLGAWSVVKSWALIIFAFGLSIVFPNPISFLITIILLAGAHVGLAILMHDASHRALFASPLVNEWVGEWLCAKPIFQSLEGYRSYHMAHHRLAGTAEDPDLVMTQNYPIPRSSLRRKLLRDISGMTGIKTYIGLTLMHAEQLKYMLNGQVIPNPNAPRGFIAISKTLVKNLHAFVITNIVIFAVLWVIHAPWLYLLWVIAQLSPFQVFLRVRQIADHAVVPDSLSKNPLLHARSTTASWWEKMLFAPHHEHYHLEHHLVPTAPSWNLTTLHNILIEANALPEGSQSNGYAAVLRKAVTPSK